jgi:hypothetical protein
LRDDVCEPLNKTGIFNDILGDSANVGLANEGVGEAEKLAHRWNDGITSKDLSVSFFWFSCNEVGESFSFNVLSPLLEAGFRSG